MHIFFYIRFIYTFFFIRLIYTNVKRELSFIHKLQGASKKEKTLREGSVRKRPIEVGNLV